MKVETYLFSGLTLFFLVVTVIYGLWTGIDEPVGFYALMLTTLMSALVGGYLAITRRTIDPRPEDNPDALISELAGEQGHYSPWSWWPLPLAAAGALVFLGIAVEWWVAVIGLGVGIVATVGWVFEYYQGAHSH